MGFADTDQTPRRGPPHSHPASFRPRSRHNHSRRFDERDRDVAMNRDDENRGDRGRTGRDRDSGAQPQTSHDRPLRSTSPAPRRVEAFRDRDYSRDTRRDDFRDRDDIPKGPRNRSRSPISPGKRRRSPSPGPGPHRGSKKSKREREREKRRARRNRHRQSSPHRRSPSPYRSHHRSDRPGSFDAEPLRDRSRSPHFAREAGSEMNQSPHAHPRRASMLSERSRSPRPGSRQSVLSRAQSPYPNPPPHSEAGSYSRRSSPAFETSFSTRPPRSPRMDRQPPTGPSASRNKKKRREDPRFVKRGQPSSGANSIEVNFSRRGDVRSTFASQAPPSFASTRSRDPRHDLSPVHRVSSRHASPSAESPHGLSAQEDRSTQHQFSPQNAPPSGPRVQLGQSSPRAPTGPSNPGRGFSRSGFRGGSFSSVNAESRGGAFNPPTGPAADRVHSARSGENTPNPSSASHHSDAVALTSNEVDDDAFRPQELHVETQMYEVTEEQKDDEHLDPPVRAPPTGPAVQAPTGPKISFSFKATSKAPVAAPKPEISQKFSAVPPRRDAPQPVDDRSNRERDLPKDVPTGPASSRARHEPDHHGRRRGPEPPREPPRGPRQTEPPRGPRQPELPKAPRPPRTRKIKKIERRLKPKPTLAEHLALSESPFYRKPGNESVVGSGTYGKVFKGQHVYSGRLVALKKIRMEGEKDGFPVTAVREIKLLQSLRHENIVALQEVMIEQDACYMVFEYLSHDLTGLINHPSFILNPAQRKHLAKQLFEGLDYLHTRGVLHRDIKAANILVSSNGLLKIADFGLARFYAKHHHNDYTNRVITIWYRSPELLLGETQYTAAVDVWSAACVMVEIFTRHAIFPGDGTEINQLDKIYAVLGTPNKTEWPDLVKMEWFELLRPSYRKPNVFAEKYKGKIPASAFELLASMFQYDPAKRPSAAEVLEHPYFTTEQPPPQQAVELADIVGEWHEFESKALRKEKERKEKQEREARRAAQAREAEKIGGQRDNDRKRPGSSHDTRDTKRLHTEGQLAPSGQPSDTL